MKTIQIDDILGQILNDENINPENALKEYALLDLLSKKDKYNLIIVNFERKYQSSFFDAEQQTHSEKNTENFEAEDDLMDWEFAIKSLEVIEDYLAKIGKLSQAS